MKQEQRQIAMKRIIPVVLILIVVTAGVIYWRRTERSRSAENSHLRLSGNVEAHESVVGFRTQGRIIELPVEEGMAVKEGDLIATLDDSDYRQQVSIDEAHVRARMAELRLAQAGGRQQDVKAAEQALADAKADLELKRVDYERYEALYKKDAISAQARDSASTALTRARANVQRLEENLSAVREGLRPEQIDVNRANLSTAKQNVEMSRVKLGFTVLRAPTAGVILVRQAELGEVVSVGTPVVTIADINKLWVRVYLSETDLGAIKLGQAVTVHTDTFPDKTYPGKISFISSQAEFTPKSIETHKERVALVYRVKVDVENPNHELKPGMPADVTIQLAK
jgi:HlyD family secretion protein